MTTWETARGADGPGVIVWLKEQGEYDRLAMFERFRGMFRRWKAGGCAEFYALDAILLHTDLHPQDVPEELWRANTQRGRHCGLTAEQQAVVRGSDAGPVELAERFGVSRTAIYRVRAAA